MIVGGDGLSWPGARGRSGAKAVAHSLAVLAMCVLGALTGALGLPSSAHGQLSVVDTVHLMSGNWELDPSEEDDRGSFVCSDTPLTIQVAFNDNGEAMFTSRLVAKGQPSTSDLGLKAWGNVHDGAYSERLVIQYHDEERVTDAGDPVSWYFVMPDRDHFYWVRTDWPDGSRTALRRRCPKSGDLVS